MNALPALAVAVPLLGAAAVAAGGHLLGGRVFTAIAVAVAAATTGICVALLLHAWRGDLVYWFAGWRTHGDVALGISFVVDPTGAALAAFTSFLATGALAYSWSSYTRGEVSGLFYTLMLLFCAGMVGFALTGDLFDLFVFFELMSVAAYALTGVHVRRPTSLEGALQFAVTNSIGAFAILFGIALVYGRTGALNLAQIGEQLARRPPDGLVSVALALIVVGFLVKAGAVPFHFWLADAYSVAPAPVAALLTGVMSDLGYHGVARVYWSGFSGAVGGGEAIRDLLVALGVASALVGGVMALLQAELKRTIAFATVANGGVTLVGVGVLGVEGLAGATIWVVAAGLARAAAILVVGVCIHHLGSGDELELHGRGRRRRFVPLGIAFGLCALALTAAPPFGPFFGEAFVAQAAAGAGFGWAPALLALGTALVAAALFRAGARVFLGLGPARDPLLARQEDEAQEGEEEDEDAKPRQAPLLVPIYLFLVVALALPAVPALAGRATVAAHRQVDRAGQVREVLRGEPPPPPPARLPEPAFSPVRWAYGGGAFVAALGLAALLLWRSRLPRRLRLAGAAPVRPAAAALHTVHSGALGDYVTWLALGLAGVSIFWSLALGGP